jgi:DUF1016 N-terminal domain/YhcG PDDEXK nuclease domain
METQDLYNSIKSVLDNARQQVVRAVNTTMVEAYWQIGRLIVEEEQHGKDRAQYGKQQLKEIADRLTVEFGAGFPETNLKYMRLVFLAFPIRHTLRDELSWSHYRLLTKVENEKARAWYVAEAVAQNWSSRALDRQINSLYYERLLTTHEANRPDIRQEAEEKTKPFALKTTKLTHQDIGQMDMYVRMYEDLHKLPGDNPTIGLILCTEKEATVVKYSVLNGSENLFASRYKSVLPTEDELKIEIERERFLLEQTRQTT